MARCSNCQFAKIITDGIRFNLSQENKEILNILLDRHYSLDEFRYCEKNGFVESAIMVRDCVDWQLVEESESHCQ
jgi:hypothetical protein